MMKRLFLTTVAALFLATGTAHADETTLLPPAEFDVPYKGKLRIWIVQSKESFLLACPPPKGLFRVACSRLSADKATCDIWLPRMDLLKKGFEMSVMLRHELGHCNGWPSDHPNGRTVPLGDPVNVELPETTEKGDIK